MTISTPTSNQKKRDAFTILPNLLTYMRIALVPVLFSTFFLEGLTAHITALVLFTIASITDYFDGMIARSQKMTSSFGQMLDPIADKLLISSVLFLLIAWDIIVGISLFAALIILSREILVSGLREHLAQLKVRVPVTWLSKYKTVIQIIALGFLIGTPIGAQINIPAQTIGLTLLWIAAIITIYTGYGYFKVGIRHFSGDNSS